MADTSKYDRSVGLHCPTCGATQFHHDEHDESAPVTCASCGLQISRNDLIEANGENIAAHVGQMKDEVIADVRKQLRDAFSALKSFKVK